MPYKQREMVSMDLDMRSKLQEHDHEIQSVQITLQEIQTTLRHLENGQQGISNLLEAKAIHSIEIKHLSHGMERVFDEVKKIDRRMGKIETILEIEKEEKQYNHAPARHSGYGVFETFKEYWHVIAIIASIIYAILTYVLGTKH